MSEFQPEDEDFDEVESVEADDVVLPSPYDDPDAPQDDLSEGKSDATQS